jgi:hypothetical protein
MECAPHRADGHPWKPAPLQLQAQELACPSGPLPPEVGRNALQDLAQHGLEPLVRLQLTITSALIEEAVLTQGQEPLGDGNDGCRSALQVARDSLTGKALVELENHENTEGGGVVLGLSPRLHQPASHRAIKSGYVLHGKVISFVESGGIATATIDGLTFPFNFPPAIPSGDRDSRTLV